jgi:hypothetical protein
VKRPGPDKKPQNQDDSEVSLLIHLVGIKCSQMQKYMKLSDLVIGYIQISTGSIAQLFPQLCPIDEEIHQTYRHLLRCRHVISHDIYDSQDQLRHELSLILIVSVSLQDSKNQKMVMKLPTSDSLHMMESMLHGTEMNQQLRVTMLLDSMKLSE